VSSKLVKMPAPSWGTKEEAAGAILSGGTNHLVQLAEQCFVAMVYYEVGKGPGDGITVQKDTMTELHAADARGKVLNTTWISKSNLNRH